MNGFIISDIKGHQNNFDFIRFVSACFVIVTHSYVLLGIGVKQDLLMRWSNGTIMLSTLGLKCFFIISGFLISASMCNSNGYVNYLWKRCLRIFPGLIVVIILSLIVFSFISKLSLKDYFSTAETYTYLKNILLFKIYWTLPGVFTDNGNTVNGSIWTLIYEFLMYLGVMGLFMLGFFKNRFLIPSIFLCLLAFRIYMQYVTLPSKLNWYMPYTDLQMSHTIDFSLYFVAGMVVYIFKHKLQFNSLCFIFILLVWVSSFFTSYTYITHYFCIPYLLFYLAYHPLLYKFNKFARYGDFSYGMYIYAMPIQQTIIYFLGKDLNIYFYIMLSLLITLPFAILSWHFVESKALGFKNLFYRAVINCPIRE